MAGALRTQVGIVGAGPAGLTLSHPPPRAGGGSDSSVIESQTRKQVEERVRAGVLEHGTVELLDGLGLAARLKREGLAHHGIELRFAGERHPLPPTHPT